MADVKDQELKLAKAIVDQIAHDEFKPEQYEDEVKKRVLEQIQRKVEGQEIQVTEEAQPQTQIIDLMEALKASLEARGKQAAGTGPEAKEPAEATAGPAGRKPAKRAPRAAAEQKKASRK
jgi:DNA end-binding protein Ku